MSVTYGNYRWKLESSNVFVKSFYDSDTVGGHFRFAVYCELCYLHFIFSKLPAIREEQNNLPVPLQYAGFAMYLLKCNGHWFPLWESLIFYNICKVVYQFCTYLKPCAKLQTILNRLLAQYHDKIVFRAGKFNQLEPHLYNPRSPRQAASHS